MPFNVCFNKVPPFRLFAAFIKGCSTYDRDGRNGGQPTRGDDSQGMKVFAVGKQGLPEDFVYFRALCGV